MAYLSFSDWKDRQQEARPAAALPQRAPRLTRLACSRTEQKEEAEKYAREQAAKKAAAAKAGAKAEVPEISKAIARPMPPRKRS